MKKWLINNMNTIVGIARKYGITTHPFARRAVAQWREIVRLQNNDPLNPFSRDDGVTVWGNSDSGSFRHYGNNAVSAEVSIDMSKKSIDDDAFGVDATKSDSVNGSVMRETSKENGMVSTCLFRDDNAEAWIEITFEHNDAEMRHFRY